VRLPSISSFGISARLYALAGLAFLAVAMLAAGSLHFAHLTSNAALTLGRNGLAGISQTTQFELLVTRHNHAVDAASKEGDRSKLDGLRTVLADARHRIEALAAASALGLHGSKAARLVPELSARADLVLEFAELQLSDKVRDALVRYETTAQAIIRQLRGERAEHVARAEESMSLLRDHARALVRWVVGTGLVALILIGPVSLPLLRQAIFRLGEITRGMLRLAANDTSVDVPGTEERDEIGAMARALQVFKANAISLLEQQGQLKQLNFTLDIALNSMSRGLSMLDANGCLVVTNASFARMYGLPPHLVEPGTSIAAIFGHLDRTGVVLEAGAALEAQPEVLSYDTIYNGIYNGRSETTFVQTTEAGRVISVSLQPIHGGGFVALHQDITEQRTHEERIARLARQDSLTKLENRRGLQDALANACQALDDAHGFAMHCIDLDKFKIVNDVHGHQAGDALLEAVAQRLRNAARREDVVARLGGDEFAIIQNNVSHLDEARALGERIVDEIGRPYEIRGTSISIGASVGVSVAPDHGRSPEQLLRHADVALYAAKSSGRNTCIMFDAAMDERIRARRQLERDVRQALAYSEISLQFQPIIDLASNRVISCEALMRWTHRERGAVSPADFIPIAEETGVIHELGAWALAEATRVAASWPEDIRVSVNLSPVQFAGPDLCAIVAAALEDSHLSAARLELEITESVLLREDDASRSVLHQLRDLGVSIALDDFGTGYSSLSYLRSFPFSKLKIDRSFVRDLPDRSDCVAIVQAITSLARSLDMTTVAEGVETHDHLHKVRAAGCDQVQGYLFSKPVPAEALEAVFAECRQKARFAA
jgi:diguanylate cyclase (GGDEF)-like protein